MVKAGVSLGGLTDADRAVVLGVAAQCLPEGVDHSEAQVNEVLKTALAGVIAFLATDHVELRRWLVDAGWWRRDGFGRVYCRVPLAELPPALQGVAADLRTVDLPAWIEARRDAHRQMRDQRRRLHEALSAAGRRG